MKKFYDSELAGRQDEMAWYMEHLAKKEMKVDESEAVVVKKISTYEKEKVAENIGVYSILVVHRDGNPQILLVKNNKENNKKEEKPLVRLNSSDLFLPGELGRWLYIQLDSFLRSTKLKPVSAEMLEVVSGGVEISDSDPLAAIVREIKEELGLEISQESIVSLEEPLTEELKNTLGSILVNQLRDGQLTQFKLKGFISLIDDTHLNRLDKLGKEYQLVPLSDFVTNYIGELRPATVAILAHLIFYFDIFPQEVKAILGTAATNIILFPNIGLDANNFNNSAAGD